MKKLILVCSLLVAMASIGFGQRETAAEAAKEFASAKWLKVGADAQGFPISINTSDIQRINGIVGFRTKYEKRGTTVYGAYFGNCTTDKLLESPLGWATYAGSSKLVSVSIEFSAEQDANGLMTVVPQTIGWNLLDYACEHPTSVKVFQQ